MGRRIQYEFSQEMADEICEATELNPLGLKALCKKFPHFPSPRAIGLWQERHPLFKEQYARAKAAQVLHLADEIIEIADDDSRDLIQGEEGLTPNSAAINHDRLRIDSRKWIASKLLPKIYGEKKESEEKDGSDFISKNRDSITNK